MPTGKNGSLPSHGGGQEQPVVFQKHFKAGSRTYAAQIKLGTSGRKYLLLSEGSKNPETREIKHHFIRVHEQDLKAFFSMLQETVVYLRAAKSLGNTMNGVVAHTAEEPVQTDSPKTATPPSASAVKSVAKSAVKSQVAAKPLRRTSVKPPVTEVVKPTKLGSRVQRTR